MITKEAFISKLSQNSLSKESYVSGTKLKSVLDSHAPHGHFD
jgi:hypothetical protein